MKILLNGSAFYFELQKKIFCYPLLTLKFELLGAWTELHILLNGSAFYFELQKKIFCYPLLTLKFELPGAWTDLHVLLNGSAFYFELQKKIFCYSLLTFPPSKKLSFKSNKSLATLLMKTAILLQSLFNIILRFGH